MNEINEFRGKYNYLSNFYILRQPIPANWEGYYARTAEHAYQACKAVNHLEAIRILGARTPGQAKRLGSGCILRPDWDQIKLEVMERIVRAKFQHNGLLMSLLIKTGDAVLVEGNNWGDTYWGICRGKGYNHLGKILMKVRDEMRRVK